MLSKKIKELLFPCRCAACGAVYKNFYELPFCPICAKKWRCAVNSLDARSCGLPSVILDNSLPPERGGVLSALVSYRSHTLERGFEIGRQVIFALKKDGAQRLDRFIADAFFTRIKALGIRDLTHTAVVSIPRNRENYLNVGVDNMRSVGKLLAELLDSEYVSAIKQKKRAREQKKLTVSERFQNAEGRFSIAPKALDSLENKDIILIDDVVTTGATLCAAMHCLLDEGKARRVYIFVVAVNDRIKPDSPKRTASPNEYSKSCNDKNEKYDTVSLWD